MEKHDKEHESSFCPKCGMVMFSDHYSIDWNDNAKQFVVSAKFPFCRGCGAPGRNLTVSQLPLVIAQESRCSCGGVMALSSYSLKRVKDDLEFEGRYVCPKCSGKKQSQFSGLKSGLLEIWRRTTKIEVGPSGVTYEKAAS